MFRVHADLNRKRNVSIPDNVALYRRQRSLCRFCTISYTHKRTCMYSEGGLDEAREPHAAIETKSKNYRL